MNETTHITGMVLIFNMSVGYADQDKMVNISWGSAFPTNNDIPSASNASLNNSDHQKFEMAHSVINRCVTPILCVIGLVGNLFNVVVLTHHRFKVSCRVCIAQC